MRLWARASHRILRSTHWAQTVREYPSMCRTSFWRPTDRSAIQTACMDVEQEGWQIQSPGFYIPLSLSFSLNKLKSILVYISMFFFKNKNVWAWGSVGEGCHYIWHWTPAASSRTGGGPAQGWCFLDLHVLTIRGLMDCDLSMLFIILTLVGFWFYTGTR